MSSAIVSSVQSKITQVNAHRVCPWYIRTAVQKGPCVAQLWGYIKLFSTDSMASIRLNHALRITSDQSLPVWRQVFVEEKMGDELEPIAILEAILTEGRSIRLISFPFSVFVLACSS